MSRRVGRLAFVWFLVVLAMASVARAQSPTITAISPASPTVSAASQTITVTGTNFQAGSILTVTAPRVFFVTGPFQLQSFTATSFQVGNLFLSGLGTYTFQLQSPSGDKSNVFSVTTQFSTSGATWIPEGVRMTDVSSGFPGGGIADVAAIHLKDGQWRLIYNSIMSAISPDGLSLKVEQPVHGLAGLTPDQSIAHLPRLFALPSGQIRVYFGCCSGAAAGIYSAISSDEGLTWTLESGARILLSATGITLPQAFLSGLSVVPTRDGKWRGYFSYQIPQTFAETQLSMMSATSSDLLNWTVDPGVRIGPGSQIAGSVLHPKAMANSDASITVFYYRQASPQGIYASTSADGLMFTTETLLESLGQGGDPEVVQVGTDLRMYYNWGDNNGGAIYSALYPTGAIATTSLVTASPSLLRFAATKAGAAGALTAVTAGQAGTVAFTGAGSAWTATANQPWVQITNGSGTGSGQFTASIVNTNNVLGGSTSLTATITVSAPAATNTSVTIPVTLTIDQTGGSATAAPFGQVDTPAQGTTGVQGAISVTGWALDDVGVASVKIYRNCLSFDAPASCQAILGTDVVFVGDAVFVAGARPDVEAAFPLVPQAYRGGWGYLLLTNMLPHVPNSLGFGGQGALTLFAFATDAEGHLTLLGRTPTDHTPTAITMTNDSIAKPFGSIDVPTQGQTVSGTFANFGWVLTPDSNTIADATDILMPVDGSTMNVFIDGVVVGTAAYNQCRGNVGNPVPATLFCNDDVANIFGNATPQPVLTPRTANATKHRNLDAGRAVIGAFTINTTTLTNGAHSLAWSATDSAGRNEGIGSRSFTVLNSGADAPADIPADTPNGAADLPVGRLRADLKVGASVRTGIVEKPDVWGRTGFDLQAPFAVIDPVGGVRPVEIGEMGRVEVWLGPVDGGYLVANGTLRDLPTGSHLDATTGQFTWAPGPGYLGTYHLVFLRGTDRVLVDVTILPR